MSNEPQHWLSLGAGVQSSTLALMAAAGEVGPMPTGAIFADTQDEPASVYRWLDWLEKQLPFPVHRVTAGRLSDSVLKMRTTKDGRKYSRTNIPFFTLSARGEVGKIMHRSCTADYKIVPIIKHLRHQIGPTLIRQWQAASRKLSAAGVEPMPLAFQWIGISLDEMSRMKKGRDPWAECRWPLIEMRMTRHACLEWMQARGYPTPPRSSCVYCPYHRNDEWRRLQTEEPEEFAKAVAFEKALQAAKATTENFASTPFLHRSCKPLDTIDFRSDVERGQGVFEWGFADECEGMCGN